MKLIKSKVEYLPQDIGLEGVYKQIEKCGRVSYKSEDKITEKSAEPFVDRLIKANHGAVLEHGTVYLDLPNSAGDFCAVESYATNNYSKLTIVTEKDRVHNYVTTNFRVIAENEWFDDLQYVCEPTEYHEKRYTFKFTCSRAIANELTRHRVFSFCQESTRFCNYSKGKFNGKVSFIVPSWCNFTSAQIKEYEKGNIGHSGIGAYTLLNGLLEAESAYKTMLLDDCTPQQARDVLPLATKTELVMTGFASDWRTLIDIRFGEKTGAVHPDMKDLMAKLINVAEKANILNDIMKYPSKFK